MILFQNEFYMHCNPTFYATLLCPTKRYPAAISIYLAHEIKYQVSKQQRWWSKFWRGLFVYLQNCMNFLSLFWSKRIACLYFFFFANSFFKNTLDVTLICLDIFYSCYRITFRNVKYCMIEIIKTLYWFYVVEFMFAWVAI